MNGEIQDIEEMCQILIPSRNEINKRIKHAAEYSTCFMSKSATSSVMKSHAFVHYGLKEISPVCHKAISHNWESQDASATDKSATSTLTETHVYL